MALPRELRQRFAALVLQGFHDPGARQVLENLWRICEGSASGPSGTGEIVSEELCARARRAWGLLRGRRLSAPKPTFDEALEDAADLFDVGLYFEVHELLEPYWSRAEGREHEMLQGLIQVAAGFHHLQNGNLGGCRSLLEEGGPKLLHASLDGTATHRFAVEILDLLKGVATPFDRSRTPRFPRQAGE